MIRNARHLAVFTGAGISVESGIPPFRGPDGLYARYDPRIFDAKYFREHTRECWRFLHEIFYRDLKSARPNRAHLGLARMEQAGLVRAIITQNIDNLHLLAGSRTVFHFHGTIGRLRCLQCRREFLLTEIDFQRIPPECTGCGGWLKPDIVFFGEPIPRPALEGSLREALKADLFLIIGSTGEVLPAATIPRLAKEHHARILEINTQNSLFTSTITDVFLKGPAAEIVDELCGELS